jgi:small redox-active disulfide protein 2
MLSIKVPGSGCENCKKVEALARNVINALSIDAQIEKITEHADIMQYKILSTPGLVINEKVVCAGRIPNETEVTTWFVNALEE